MSKIRGAHALLLPRCPECEAGKHANCTGFAYDEADTEVVCGCTCRD